MVSILSQQNGENSSFSNKKTKKVSGNLMSLDEVDPLDAEDIALGNLLEYFSGALKIVSRCFFYMGYARGT